MRAQVGVTPSTQLCPCPIGSCSHTSTRREHASQQVPIGRAAQLRRGSRVLVTVRRTPCAGSVLGKEIDQWMSQVSDEGVHAQAIIAP